VPGRRLLFGALVVGAVATVAACGSSSSSGAASSASRSAAVGTPSAVAAITISATNVPGVGTVLVNGHGRTLHLLTSEKGGKITSADNGCTKPWPDTELPQGVTAATAGSGIQVSMLGTAKDASGSLYVTYNK
jgi:predicted lipoprotein with Yx(FWY)xxD motif